MLEKEITTETVQRAVTIASALNHLKNNRMEYLLVTTILYLTGLGSDLWAKTAGMCV
jgi:hypothetical protein